MTSVKYARKPTKEEFASRLAYISPWETHEGMTRKEIWESLSFYLANMMEISDTWTTARLYARLKKERLKSER